MCVAVSIGLPPVNGSKAHLAPAPSLPSTTTWMLKVLEGPGPRPAESLAVPGWLADDPELRRRGITLVECLRPVSVTLILDPASVSVLPRRK